MKNYKEITKYILVFLFVVFISLNTYSQNMLGDSYSNIRNGAMQYNDVIYAMLYKENPIILIINRKKVSPEYTKTYIFNKEICISETYFYPKDDFNQRKNLFVALYGEPQLENEVYYWISDGLKITITTLFNKMCNNTICQINYAKTDDLPYLIEVTQQSQTPFMKMVKLKDI